jgi:hypothetical protein
MALIVEVQPIFEDELIEHTRRNHLENIDYVYTNATSDLITQRNVSAGDIRVKTAGYIVNRVLTEIDHVADFGCRCEDFL